MCRLLVASMNQMYMQLMSLRVSHWSLNHLSLPQDALAWHP